MRLMGLMQSISVTGHLEMTQKALLKSWKGCTTMRIEDRLKWWDLFFFYLLLMSLPWCSTSIIKNRLKDTKQCGASRSLMPAHTARGHLLNRTVYQTEASLHFMNKSGSQHIVLTSLNKAVFLLIDQHSLAVFALPGYHSLRQDLVRFLFLPNPYISNDTIKIEYFRNKVNILFVVIW